LAGDVFEETIDKVSKADVDRYVTPFGKRRITMNLIPARNPSALLARA